MSWEMTSRVWIRCEEGCLDPEFYQEENPEELTPLYWQATEVREHGYPNPSYVEGSLICKDCGRAGQVVGRAG